MHTDRLHGMTGRIVGFCRFARAHGLNAGIQETLDALEAARLGTLTDKAAFKRALRALLCTSRADCDLFDELYAAYWEGTPLPTRRRNRPPKSQPLTKQHKNVPLLTIGSETERAPEEEGRSTAGASATERLRTTDFAKVSPPDQEPLEQLARRLWTQMSLRLARRLRSMNQRRQIDLRRTIRHSIPHGGDPIELSYRGRRKRKPRLVLLLDVSGSMDRYSFFLLRFIHTLQRHFQRVDSFLFSTRLTCITDALNTPHLPDTLAALSETAEAWSSGTRIGACLRTFNDQYGRQLRSSDTLVLILSDGLDTGAPALLERELRRIKRRSRKLIWLNPLLGMDDYQPLARGIRVALPYLDEFLSAHNLESLLQLETHLRHV